ncbi:ComF family protein [Natranaerovirga pectinivora]|uniref:ComF family protein n=1 Tax=Natranaerovirga pectinivora TaxID=682400 RepID=A0A4R3MM43_9FIRM|nr:ComF family protein [Natranaerovirga pectinivora]TCT14010.1 ComF family protein [Natranaerovirga pectinivora]
MDYITKMLDIIYPPRCPLCNDIIPWFEEKRICTGCLEKSPIIEGPRCTKCSKPVFHQEITHCFDCHKQELAYEKGWSLWSYEEPVKKAIYQYKYHNKREYAPLFAKELVSEFKSDIEKYNIGTIVPVPLSKKRQRTRGYNQAYLLAKEIGKLLDKEVVELLERHLDTLPQKELNDKERLKNLNKVFSVNNDKKVLNNILIVDDIYTTGSTINACAMSIKEHYDTDIYYICIAIGKGI